jgi:hypothetical protein
MRFRAWNLRLSTYRWGTLRSGLSLQQTLLSEDKDTSPAQNAVPGSSEELQYREKLQELPKYSHGIR